VSNKHKEQVVSALAALKLTAAKKPSQLAPIVQQRNKLAKRIWEQIELAKAQSNGGTFTSKRLKSVRDIDGVRKTVEVAKRVKHWWFVADNGKLCLAIRYGSKLLELSKGKSAVELASGDEIVRTLEIVQTAVMNGELDSQIENASGSLRAGFKR
jgi:hypothetical protein